jgi:hypothetical protein
VAGLYPRLGFAARDGGRFHRDVAAPADDLTTHIAPA